MTSDTEFIQDKKMVGSWEAADKMAASFMGEKLFIGLNSVDFSHMGKSRIAYLNKEKGILKVDEQNYTGQLTGIKFYQLGTLKRMEDNPEGVMYEMVVTLYATEADALSGKAAKKGVYWKYGNAEPINDFSISDDNNLNFIAKSGKQVSVAIGSNISELERSLALKKSTEETGEGTFTIWNMVDKNHGVLGYVMEHPEKQDVIHRMYITSDKVEYFGLRIGSTWADILKAEPNAVAHGSEIESTVSVQIGEKYFELDMQESNYNFDNTKIKADTKVIGIWL